jgi:hypothetical protein
MSNNTTNATCRVTPRRIEMSETKPETVWKLMPFPPTEEMARAGNAALSSADAYLHTVRGCYNSMFNAAPTPPAPEPISMEPVAWIQCTPDGTLVVQEVSWVKHDLDLWDRQMGWTSLPLYSTEQIAALEAKCERLQQESNHWKESFRLASDSHLTAQAECERLQGERDELLDALKSFASDLQDTAVTFKVAGRSVKAEMLANMFDVIAKIEAQHQVVAPEQQDEPCECCFVRGCGGECMGDGLLGG